MKGNPFVLGVCVVMGCSAPGPEEEPIEGLDRRVFQESIEPVLQQRCANPSCHGRLERPWAIYAPGRFRLDPTRVFIDEELSAREEEHNFWVSSVFAGLGGMQAKERLLIQKPLAQVVYHGGGVVFMGERDEAARRLLAWIEAGSLSVKEPGP